MIRLTTTTFLAMLVAAGVAWKLGGTMGTGVMIGFLFGAGCTGLGVLYQRHVLVTDASHALHAFAFAFGAKLVVLVMGALAFRYIDEVAARADWRGFLIAFAAAVAVILPLGSLDAIQVLRQKTAEANLPANSEAGH